MSIARRSTAAPGIYSEWGAEYLDNHIRFGVLNLAALEIARQIFPPDIFHAHDWPAGLLAPYLRETFAADPGFRAAKCVFTIHNLGYQGNFPGYLLPDLGLSPALFHPEGLEFWGELSFLKAGIVWSDAITTVSPTYAREIQTPEYGHGLDGVLRGAPPASPAFSTASTMPSGTRRTTSTCATIIPPAIFWANASQSGRCSER